MLAILIVFILSFSSCVYGNQSIYGDRFVERLSYKTWTEAHNKKMV